MVRHAHSVGNEMKIIDSSAAKFDLGLSEKGKEQAQELIPKLNKYKIDAFIVSSLKRTIDTITPFLETISNPAVTINDLTLERDAGEFIGKPLVEMKEYLEKEKVDRVSFKPKNGESILEVYQRAKKFLEFLKSEFANKNVLICGHKNFLMCLKILIENKDIKDYYSFEPIKNNEIFELEA